MNQEVQGLEVMVYDNNDNFLGQYNNLFEIDRNFYEHEGDTLPSYDYLTFILQAPYHENDTITKNFSDNIHVNSTMIQIPEQKTATANLEYISQPLGHGPSLHLNFLNEQDTIYETNTTQGIATANLDFEKYKNGENVMRIINGEPITELTILASGDDHEEQEDTLPFQEEMNLTSYIQQIPQEKNAELNIEFVSNPLGYGPTLNSYLLNAQDTIAEIIIPQGITTTNIEYEEYSNPADTLRLINGEPITELTILASNEEHQEQEYTLPFQNVMNLVANIEQTPQQGTTTITTNVTGNIFNEAPNNVNIEYRNNENDEYITQGNTTNGTNTTNIPYNYWEHEDLYYRDLEEIKQTITKTGIYETLIHILNNEDQTTNYTLTQIPEEKNAEIIGNVINPEQEPLTNALIEVKHEDTTYTTTNTLENGNFETTMQYTKYTNPENQEEKITIPENIHAKISKPQYETTTTETKTLEDIVNFGEITLVPEPIIQTLNFTAKHIQVTGDPQHPQNQYEITFGDQTHTYTIGEDNEININITAEITNGNTNVTIRNIPYEASPNTPIDNDVIMFAYQNRPAFERAIASNQMYANAKYSNDQRNQLEIELEQINNKHNLEVISMRNYFVNGEDFMENHLQPDTIFMNTIIPAQILGTKSSGWNMQWAPYDHDGTIINKVQFVHVKAEINTGNPMPPEVTNRWDYAINLTKDASYRRDGQPTLEYELLEFDSFEDPEYLELANREPAYRNTVRTFSDNSITMGVNSTGFVAGGLIARGTARGPPTPLPPFTTGEEVLEATYSMANSTASGTSSGNFILTTNTDGDVVTSEMGYNLIMFRQQFPKAKQYIIAPPGR